MTRDYTVWQWGNARREEMNAPKGALEPEEKNLSKLSSN